MRRFRFNFGGLYALLQFTRENPRDRLETLLDNFKRNNVYFEGPFPSWDIAALVSTGYEAPLILEKAISSTRAVVRGKASYERDTVLFDQHAFSHPLLSWLLLVGANCDGKLHVVDFGGALGSLYFQNRAALNVFKEFTWCVVEQPHISAAGSSEFSDGTLSFCENLEEAISRRNVNVVILSSVLQYLPDPNFVLEKVFNSGVEFVVIDRTMARSQLSDEVFLQHVPKWIYEATYPVRFMNIESLERTFANFKYSVLERAAPEWSTFGSSAPHTVDELSNWGLEVETVGSTVEWPYRGWFLRREEVVT